MRKRRYGRVEGGYCGCEEIWRKLKRHLRKRCTGNITALRPGAGWRSWRRGNRRAGEGIVDKLLILISMQNCILMVQASSSKRSHQQDNSLPSRDHHGISCFQALRRSRRIEHGKPMGTERPHATLALLRNIPLDGALLRLLEKNHWIVKKLCVHCYIA